MKTRLAWALLPLLFACGLAACEIITSTDEGKLLDDPTEDTADGGAPDGGDSGAEGG